MIMNREPIGTNLGTLSEIHVFENPPKYWDEMLAQMNSAAKTGHKHITIYNEDVFDDVYCHTDQYKIICKIENIKFDFDEEGECVCFGW